MLYYVQNLVFFEGYDSYIPLPQPSRYATDSIYTEITYNIQRHGHLRQIWNESWPKECSSYIISLNHGYLHQCPV